MNIQWHLAYWLTGYSCGGSTGFEIGFRPLSHRFPISFSAKRNPISDGAIRLIDRVIQELIFKKKTSRLQKAVFSPYSKAGTPKTYLTYWYYINIISRCGSVFHFLETTELWYKRASLFKGNYHVFTVHYRFVGFRRGL